MATQAWQMPDVDAEKYQSVTKQGGARSEVGQQPYDNQRSGRM